MLSFEGPDDTASTTVQDEPTSVSRVLELAAATAQRLVADAHTEAESVLAAARVEAEAVVEAARQEARKAVADLDRLRAIQDKQRVELRQHLTEQLSRLDAVLPALPDAV